MTHRRTSTLLLLTPLVLGALASCTETVSSSGPDSQVTSTTEVTTTTESPTTTTEAPTTTEATTTTEAPTTTMAPNVEIVGTAVNPVSAFGKNNGPDAVLLQDRLTQLGFWVGDSDGNYGFATTQAVMAFQKYMGLDTNGYVDKPTADWLNAVVERGHGLSDNGTLVEVDKKRQLLFIVVDGKTLWTLNTSTGSGHAYEAPNQKDPTKIEKGDAVTPNGLWKVDRQRPDGWWDGDLGSIYRPKYFHGGIAIHGMTSVPNYPASHGCVRVSTAAMDFIWDANLVPMGTFVWVHE